jgi:uncharacterized protein
MTSPPAPEGSPPLADDELEALQALLDRLLPDREPLDVVMLDGYLCGVLLQPERVAEAAWLPLVMDVEGRPPPPGFDVERLRGWARRRHAQLDQAIARREWFDPWVYQLDDAASPSDTVLPWVAGFATAVDAFPRLMARHESVLLEPLASLYRHLDPDDLEDADALLAEIDTYEPAATLAEAVEDLVRSTLLIADVSRPLPSGARGPVHPLRRPAGGPGRRAAPAAGPAKGSRRRPRT